jgi:RNase P subunit RPR2
MAIDPVNKMIEGITKAAVFASGELPKSSDDLAKEKVQEAIKTAFDAMYCETCSTKLIVNANISRSGKRPEMYGTTTCPTCKITNRYRRFL